MRFALLLCCVVIAVPLAAQDQPGRALFEGRCSTCHGADARGGELGPPIRDRLALRSDTELEAVIRKGLPDRGMPAFNLNSLEMQLLTSFLAAMRRDDATGASRPRRRAPLTSGGTLDGIAINETMHDLQLRTADGKLHLLRSDGGRRFREVTSQVDWPGYHGGPDGNRYSTIGQIGPRNVGGLAPKWIFTLHDVPNLETTPVVVQGIMYVTNANECYALDAGSGREVWHYRRSRTAGLTGNAAGGMNRGVAVAGERVFMVTDHAHVIALDRSTGSLLWETEMADWHKSYNATSAPLIAGGLVVSGTAGGEQGARGFIAAFDQTTGKEAWRFWTVPAPGEPGSETWQGKAIEHPSSVAWFTGSYDPQMETLYWPTGNPGPDYNGDEREGDNLYSCSMLALDAKTGRLKWYYQFTPHDIWDWDATEPPVLVDAEWQGEPRKLLLQANRNGFFYVLDRLTGKMLLGKPFVKKMTWAKEIAVDGRPVLAPPQILADGSRKTCPAVEGAANWFSTSYSPVSKLFYVQSLEKCNIFVKKAGEWVVGRDYMGGLSRPVPEDRPVKVLRAIDIQTGRTVWELPQVGAAESWGGTLATSTGLVFFGEDSGMFMAVDASSGRPLWEFQTSQLWKASPMTYVFDNKQYVAVAAGQSVLAFALP